MDSRIVLTILAILSLAFGMSPTSAPSPGSSYIVQGGSLEAAKSAVIAVDGEITHELGVIRAVAADLTPKQLDAIELDRGVRRVYGNAGIEAAGKPPKDRGGSDEEDSGMAGSGYTEFPALVDADQLHDQGIDGWGVTIAIVDSGIYSGPGITQDRYGVERKTIRPRQV